MISIQRQEEAFGIMKDQRKLITLEDYATFSKGKGISKSDIKKDGKFETIRYGELYTKYDERIDEVYSKTDMNNNLIKSKKGDILIPSSGETAIDLATASCLMNENILIGGDINIIRTFNECLNPLYLSYYINSSKKKEVSKMAQGISVMHIYNSSLKKLTFRISELKEQNKIANFLTSLDDLIQSQEQYIEALKVQKKGYSQKIFNDKSIKYKLLGDICTIRYGYTPSTSDDSNFGGGIPWVSVSDMNGRKIFKTKRTLSKKSENKNKLIPENTLIMSFKLTVGKLAIIQKQMYSNEAIANFTNIKDLTKEYLFYGLENTNIKKYGSQAAQGITLNNDLLKTIKIPITKNNIKVGNFLSTLDDKIDFQEEKLNILKLKKKYYLNKIFQ